MQTPQQAMCTQPNNNNSWHNPRPPSIKLDVGMKKTPHHASSQHPDDKSKINKIKSWVQNPFKKDFKKEEQHQVFDISSELKKTIVLITYGYL
jgi:hypothetical protein